MIVSVKEAIVETVHARVGAWVYVLPIRSISLMCHSTIQEWSENDKYKENGVIFLSRDWLCKWIGTKIVLIDFVL
jgi:hypothetical protein